MFLVYVAECIDVLAADVSDVVAALHAIAPPGSPDGVNLIDEDNTRRFLASLLKEVADAGGADADEHLHEIGPGNGKERHFRLARNRACQQRLTSTRRAHHQHALGNLAAEALELLGVFEELDDLFELFLGLVRAGDVLSAGLVYVGAELLSLSIRGFAAVNVVLVLVWIAIAVYIGREYTRLSAARERDRNGALVQAFDVWARGQTVTALVTEAGSEQTDLLGALDELQDLYDRQYRALASARMFVSGRDSALIDTLQARAARAAAEKHTAAEAAREKGLVLHAHLPYVRHPEYKSFLEEYWLFEAITETYNRHSLYEEKLQELITLATGP